LKKGTQKRARGQKKTPGRFLRAFFCPRVEIDPFPAKGRRSMFAEDEFCDMRENRRA